MRKLPAIPEKIKAISKRQSGNQKKAGKFMKWIQDTQKWRKTDNAALAFPPVTGKNDTVSVSFLLSVKGRS